MHRNQICFEISDRLSCAQQLFLKGDAFIPHILCLFFFSLPTFIYFNRKHFPSLCFQSGWTESIPELINISQDQILPEQLTHECIPCIPEERLGITAYLVKQHWKVYHNTTTSNQMIIFADKEENLRIYLDYLTAYLRKAFPDDPLIKSQEDNMKTFLTVLTSTMDVQERKYALERFRSGESKLLLCTDLASRGLDIPATGLVVQVSTLKIAFPKCVQVMMILMIMMISVC